MVKNLLGRIFVRTTRYRDTHNTFYRVVDAQPDHLLVQEIGTKTVSGDMWAGREVPVDELRVDQNPLRAFPRRSTSGSVTLYIRPFKQWRDTEPIYPYVDGKEYGFTNYE